MQPRTERIFAAVDTTIAFVFNAVWIFAVVWVAMFVWMLAYMSGWVPVLPPIWFWIMIWLILLILATDQRRRRLLRAANQPLQWTGPGRQADCDIWGNPARPGH